MQQINKLILITLILGLVAVVYVYKYYTTPVNVYVCTYHYAPNIPSNGILKPVCLLDNGSLFDSCVNCIYKGRVVMSHNTLGGYLFKNNTT